MCDQASSSLVSILFFSRGTTTCFQSRHDYEVLVKSVCSDICSETSCVCVCNCMWFLINESSSKLGKFVSNKFYFMKSSSKLDKKNQGVYREVQFVPRKS